MNGKRKLFFLFTILLTVMLMGCNSPKMVETTTSAPTSNTTPTADIPTATSPVSPTATTTAATTADTSATTTTAVPATTTAVATTTVTEIKKFLAASPVSVLTASDIEKLGVNVSGTKAEIANGIRQWQEANMLYGPRGDNFSDAIRWNYFLPGIFPARDIMTEHVENGKIYGICFDYAVIYCSIGQYYGLECRVRNSISKPSDTDPSITMTKGMSPDEYQRLAAKLQKLGVKYDYDAVRLVAGETPAHYWAEVKIDGVWIVQDATQLSTGGNTKENYIDTGDNEITDWLSRDKSAVLDEYQKKLDAGQRLPEP